MVRHMRRIASLLLLFALLAPTPVISLRAQGSFDDWLGKGAGLLGGQGERPERAATSRSEAGTGLREALVVGIERVVATLGRPGGFLDSARFHIPLPSPFAGAGKILRMVGLSAVADDLERRMNRAAEQAVPVAKDLFVEAIRNLTFADALSILRGPPDAATRYLERSTGEVLEARMRPIVERQLADVGALGLYHRLVGEAADIPFLDKPETTLTDHVVRRAREALFTRLAEEEKRIRTNPAARTTELLRRVFGG